MPDRLTMRHIAGSLGERGGSCEKCEWSQMMGRAQDRKLSVRHSPLGGSLRGLQPCLLAYTR